MRRVVLSVVFVVAAAAVARADEGEEDIALLERFAAIVDQNRSTCDKMAEELNRFFDANAARLNAMREREKRRSAAEKKAWQEKYGERAQAAQDKIKAGVTACAKNPATLAALKRFPK
ncbi:MAG TPA: hypothetical protein VKE22_00995 [Haliangiales bacterium]|nr:hypothetical protein [Haliangiales bacterium]